MVPSGSKQLLDSSRRIVHCILDGFPSLSHVTTSVRNVGRFYPGHAWINFVKKWRWGGEKKRKTTNEFFGTPFLTFHGKNLHSEVTQYGIVT